MQYSTNEGEDWSLVPSGWFELGGYNWSRSFANENPYSSIGWAAQSPDFPEYNSVRINLQSLGNEDKVRFRWLYGEVSMPYQTQSDGWWLDDIALNDGDAEIYSGSIEKDSFQFVARVGNPADGSPEWSWAKSVDPKEFAINDVHVGTDGQPLVAGTVNNEKF